MTRTRTPDDLADHHRQLLSPLTTFRAHLPSGQLDSSRGGPPLHWFPAAHNG